MDHVLDAIELRVLGSLIEKELTTPEYYPLSVNALVNACNQKSNRDPAMSLDEGQVLRALDSLRFKQFALLSGEGGRVAKYRHALVEKYRFSPADLSLLCELMLRGPQTTGELRTRGERMHRFVDLAAVEATLEELMQRTPPCVAKLPRQPGRKESRYCQLFSGEPDLSQETVGADLKAVQGGEGERIAALEQEVAELRQEMAELYQTVKDLKQALE